MDQIRPDPNRAKARGAKASVANLALQQLTVQQGTQSLPVAVRTEVHPSRCALMFHSGQAGATFGVDGVGLDPGMFVLGAPGTNHFLQIPADCRWSTVTLPPDTYAGAYGALSGRNASTVITTAIIRPAPAALARLRAHHNSIISLVEGKLDINQHPEAARAADQTLLVALTDCFSVHAQIVAPDLDARKRTNLSRNFYRLLEESEGQPVYLAEACILLGVAVRTLHTACMEHTGLSPHRYLWLRRMHLARRALIEAESQRASVTGIAADFGFWEFGRFSVRYEWVFGESPSVTLARPSA